MELTMFANTLETAFYIVGIAYMAIMLIIVIGAIIAGLTFKRRIEQRIKDIKSAPLRGEVFALIF